MLQLRAVTLTGYVDVANFVGLDGLRMLRQAGLSPQDLADPENRLSATVVARLLEDSAAQSGCESFGLLLAECRTFGSLGPISLLLERLPNAREIVRAVIDFQRHFNDALVASMEDHGDTCLVRLELTPPARGAQALDVTLGIGFRVLTKATGGAWTPTMVHVDHKAPADLSIWRRFFPIPVEFDSGFSGFSGSREAMLARNPQADETLARHARQLLQMVPASDPETTGARVRRSITLLLPSGNATVGQVAAQLGVSTRSLQRTLDREGLQFGELLDAVRRELATAYLTGSARPVTAIAALLGYASPSSFTRWFTGAFGVSPQAWRAQPAARPDR